MTLANEDCQIANIAQLITVTIVQRRAHSFGRQRHMSDCAALSDKAVKWKGNHQSLRVNQQRCLQISDTCIIIIVSKFACLCC